MLTLESRTRSCKRRVSMVAVLKILEAIMLQVAVLKIQQAIMLLVVTVILAVSLPLMGVSLVCFLLIDFWRWRQAQRA